MKCRYFSALVLTAFCGCQAVKDARRAQTAADRLSGERTITARELGFNEASPLALTNLEHVALLYRPSVLEARQAVESARLQCRMKHAGRLPQISSSAGYSTSTQNSQGRPSSTDMQGDWSGSLGLDLLLYDFGKLSAEERQAREALIAAEEQLRTTELDVVYAVRTAFFELHRSIELYGVAQETVKQYAEHLEEARVMVEVGTRRQYDATKAEVDWGNAALDVITVSNAVVTTRAQLNRALGLAEFPPFSILDDTMPPRPEPEVAVLMAQARTNNPSLAVLRARARSASAYVDQTVAELFPDLTLSSSLNLSGSDFPIAWNFSWASRLAQELFTGFRKTDRMRDAVTQLRTARSREADAEQTLYQNLIDAVAQYKSARKRFEIAQMIERQAKENREIVNEQYRVGLSSAIERTDAQVAVTQAQADVVRARYDEQASRARIAQLVGDTVSQAWPAEEPPAPLP